MEGLKQPKEGFWGGDRGKRGVKGGKTWGPSEDVMYTGPQWLERRSICVHDVYLWPRLVFSLRMRVQRGPVGVQWG